MCVNTRREIGDFGFELRSLMELTIRCACNISNAAAF